MAIRVTCPGCHTRFDVSDKFAGQEGPCPKCKKPIKIPSLEEQVKIHAPEDFGPKDKSGRASLKPIFREQASMTPLSVALIVAPIVGFLLLSLLSRFIFAAESYPVLLVALGAVLIAVPCVWGSYTVLRNQEGGAFQGTDLWIRIGAVAAVYALLWGSMWLSKIAFADNVGVGSWATSLIAIFALGAAACMLVLEMDYLMGLVHVGIYVASCGVGKDSCRHWSFALDDGWNRWW